MMKLLLAASEMVVSCPIGTNLTLEKEVKIGQARKILESLVKSRRKRPFISPPTDAFRLYILLEEILEKNLSYVSEFLGLNSLDAHSWDVSQKNSNVRDCFEVQTFKTWWPE